MDKMFDIKGSFAGAIGIPQFMPSNIEKYGKDGNSDKKIDLFNVPDAIKSAAHFLEKKNWRKGGDIIILEPKNLDKYEINRAITKCKNTYIVLDGKKKYISNNFCVLKRYNNNNNYAMVVYELSVEIKKRYYNS
jgi:membrane-bound lytic murein transglycosylase B